MNSPRLTGNAWRAVRHRGSHLQIIACAGSGKTEIVAQRAADLFADGAAPAAVVAFTFTDRAAQALKHRIGQRVAERLGEPFLGRLNGCFIGTIHSYCFHLLQTYVARYENFDVLDEHELTAFLMRVHRTIQLKDIDGQLFSSLKVFTRNLQVVENELLSPSQLQAPFGDILRRFHEELEGHRFLTFGQVITKAVEALDDSRVFAAVHGPLKHLIVDEYQDINPAQEALIARLAMPPVHLCVVGDDDQAIYQWRGSDVGNIVGFARRYPGVASFAITTNRRSRPAIIGAANRFAKTIQGRLDKEMGTHRDPGVTELGCWRLPTEEDEAQRIAEAIAALVAKGFRYRDIAVLVRSSASYDRLLAAFSAHEIPVQPGGRTGLFREGDAQLFGRTFAYLAGQGWRPTARATEESWTLDDLVRAYGKRFALSPSQRKQVTARLEGWRLEVQAATGPADLVGDYYALLGDCGVSSWDLRDGKAIARLGTIARCSAILVDYERTHRRPRLDPDVRGQVIGGQDRGPWYFRWLAIYIQNWAQGEWEGFDGEEAFTMDAVDLTTIHKAKGLEWPVVFVPSLTANRFPPRATGRPMNWLVPDGLFDKARYEGSLNDERRLFYVAMTRARDWLSLSTHDRPTTQRVQPSPFIRDIAGEVLEDCTEIALPCVAETGHDESDILSVTVSELAEFKMCGLAYRLRRLIGFQPPLALELGFGKAVHHVLRNVAEYTRHYGKVPDSLWLGDLFDEEFYLPAANKPAYRQMRDGARRLVDRYVAAYGEDLKRTWAVERPFELHLDQIVVAGRADVIMEGEGGRDGSLAIVDYKTRADDTQGIDQQLRIYVDAGRREGLDIRAAYVHDLHSGDRIAIDVAQDQIDVAESEVLSIAGRLKAREFPPCPGTACRGCDVRALCRYTV
ncbi:ATP-dependent DNA helicase [Acidiferrobacter sp.]|uniref:ATP-dependent helicase n=1 Tax=Acidiferrobacter sp. TaxID=1872107 RepID=UPI00262769FC|nr:ATP-dependent DNA helicase [Acidiferrobacter sp.]